MLAGCLVFRNGYIVSLYVRLCSGLELVARLLADMPGLDTAPVPFGFIATPTRRDHIGNHGRSVAVPRYDMVNVG